MPPSPTSTLDKASQEKEAAHALWVQLETRIAVQSLHQCSGDEETAVKSIVSLFATTRDLLTHYPLATGFEKLALEIINETVRRYTSRWHRWMIASDAVRDEKGEPRLEFADEWTRKNFRTELEDLRGKLTLYAQELKCLATGQPPAEGATWPQDLEALRQRMIPKPVPLGKPIKAGIRIPFLLRESPGDPSQKSLPREAINDAEAKAIHKLRMARQSPGHPIHEETPSIMDACGLALSGGGIRSATFALGIVQVLAKRGLLGQFDYLSTVSGGGYFGAFLGSYLGTSAPANNQPADDNYAKRVEALFDRPSSKDETTVHPPHPATSLPSTTPPSTDATTANPPETRAIRHLRNHSTYLLDGSPAERGVGIGIVLAGALFNLLILLPIPLLAALLTLVLYHLGFWGGGQQPIGTSWMPDLGTGSTWLLLVPASLLLIALLIFPVIKTRLVKSGRLPNWEGWVVAFFSCTAVALILWSIPLGFHFYEWINSDHWLNDAKSFKSRLEPVLLVFGITGFAGLSTLASKLKLSGWKGLALRLSAIVAFPLLYLWLYWMITSLMISGPHATGWIWGFTSATTVLIAWAGWGVDVNTYSPHHYYRKKLCECFLLRNQIAPGSPPEISASELVLLSELSSTCATPYHLINATLNLPTSKERELRGRLGDFFVFSQHHCGSPVSGYYPTKALEQADPLLDLGTAMAISGAAASSNMCWQTKPTYRMAMTLANVRLGYWLRNPIGGSEKAGKSPRPGPFWLLREMFSVRMDEKQSYLNLSDGGHIENLAAYELLRRRCKFIVCVDGGCEPDMGCRDLMRLERYAAVDLGITMHYDIADLELQANGYSRSYAVMVKIDYSPPRTEAERTKRKSHDAEWGWLLYIKLAMVGYAKGYVMDYKRDHPSFPHETTGDQIYDEAQFEAYRSLGEAAASSILTARILGGNVNDPSLKEWFQGLASSMLPDNDEIFRPVVDTPSPPSSRS
ncbi:patatin-like phospholipase family protein [Luteolibacter ambystomatis]|uniref:Patatin-like phospholipase family protein n=1 Tax=Luteolibacter ambystomatis TaxID=2824561 RepID=A0A975PGI7_9BACT|nr:patatin-like phospholipase family protein [Luteolibacter ambystomatis]QUE52286.1 patatin-like phospholipase family protein [Luteolibacter ambystomatis]